MSHRELESVDHQPAAAPRTALTYLRISEDRENDELALARQRKELAEYADRQGWRLGGEYLDNDVSASKGLRRAGYEALLRRALAGQLAA